MEFWCIKYNTRQS